jgi:hypothetical protein
LVRDPADKDDERHLQISFEAELLLQRSLTRALPSDIFQAEIAREMNIPRGIPDLVIHPVEYTNEILRSPLQQTFQATAKLSSEDFLRISSAHCRQPVAVTDAGLEKWYSPSSLRYP